MASTRLARVQCTDDVRGRLHVRPTASCAPLARLTESHLAEWACPNGLVKLVVMEKTLPYVHLRYVLCPQYAKSEVK